MGLVNKIYCEHELPFLPENLGEDEEVNFKDIVWDELPFYTSSFYDSEEEDGYAVSNYTISEDGQFYRNKTEYDLIEDENGETEIKEIDKGIERKDFTGEIHFGTEVMGKEHDYIMTFEALFFKGDLKELSTYEWKKTDNESRKKREAALRKEVESAAQKNNGWRAKLLYYLKWTPFKVLDLFKFTLVHLMGLTLRLQIWIKRLGHENQ